MLDAARYDEELARTEMYSVILELDTEAAAYSEEQLIFVLMMVPDEGSLELDELYLLAVELSDNLGSPVFGDLREFLSKIHFFHVHSV